MARNAHWLIQDVIKIGHRGLDTPLINQKARVKDSMYKDLVPLL